MAQTQAQAAVMTSTATKFEDVNQQLQTMLTQLMSQLSVLSTAWKGLGANAFEQVKVQYEADLKSLNAALAQTAGSIRESATGYDATDTEAASRVANTGGNFSLPL